MHLPKLIPPIHHSHTLHTPHTQPTQPLRSSLPSLPCPFLAFACIHDGLRSFLGTRGAQKAAEKDVTSHDPAVASGRGDEGREWGARQAHARWSKGCPPRPSFCSSARSAMPWLLFSSLLPLGSSDGGARRVGLTAQVQ